MSNYGKTLGTSAKMSSHPIPRIRASNHVKQKKKTKMKLSLKQRFRNWLMNDDDDSLYVGSSHAIEADSLASEGMRFQLYKASGGFVIETRHYDERSDRHTTKMYVINEEKDLGEELGKIITMESLR